MKCEDCDNTGSIGIEIVGKDAGMVKGINMKRVRYLCRDCHNVIPIDHTSKEPKHDRPF